MKTEHILLLFFLSFLGSCEIKQTLIVTREYGGDDEFHYYFTVSGSDYTHAGLTWGELTEAEFIAMDEAELHEMAEQDELLLHNWIMNNGERYLALAKTAVREFYKDHDGQGNLAFLEDVCICLNDRAGKEVEVVLEIKIGEVDYSRSVSFIDGKVTEVW